MKRNILGCVVVFGMLLTFLWMSDFSSGQRDDSGDDNRIRLVPGEEVLLHDSQDSIIEIYVQQIETRDETLKLRDPETGTRFPLVNGSWFRTQGRVILTRDKEARRDVNVSVQWRYVDSLFASHSRDPRR